MTKASPLENALTRELRGETSSALLVDAVALQSDPTPRWDSRRAVTTLVIGALLASSVVMARLALGPSLGGGPSQLAFPAGEMTVRVGEKTVAVDFASAGQATELASVEGGAGRPFVAQLVCSAEEGLPGIVLFGFVGAGEDPPAVSGLATGVLSAGTDGTFLYAVDAAPSPGDVWTVNAQGSVFSGPIAVWGATDASDLAGPPTCVAFDPSTAPAKP